jgi:hypothetical protein
VKEAAVRIKRKATRYEIDNSDLRLGASGRDVDDEVFRYAKPHIFKSIRNKAMVKIDKEFYALAFFEEISGKEQMIPLAAVFDNRTLDM